LKLWVDAVGAEAAGSLDLTGLTVRMAFLGH